MKCPVCSSEMHLKETMVKRLINSKPVFFTSVPALVCVNGFCDDPVAVYPDAVDVMDHVIEKCERENVEPVHSVFNFQDADEFLTV